MKKYLCSILFLLMLGLPLFAMGGGEEESDTIEGSEIVVLSWESDNPQTSTVKAHLPAFEEQTGVKVNFTTMGFGDLHTRMATLFASKSDAVDVAAVWKGSVQRFAAPGYLYDISDDVSEDYVEGLTAAVDSFRYEDGLYGLPYFMSFRMFYYNKAIFRDAGLDPDNPPETWEELVAAAKATTKDTTGNGKVDQWGLLPTGIGDADNSVMDFQMLYYLSGGDGLFDENDNPTFNSPAGVKALTLYKELYEAEVVDPASWTIDSGGDRRARWMQGHTAMVFEWPSLWKQANTLESSKVKGDVGIAPMPKIERIAGISGDEGLAVSAFSKNKKAGVALLKFISSTEINKENTLRVGWMPTQVSLLTDPDIQDDPSLAPMMKVASVQNRYYMDRFAAPYSNEVSNEALGVAIVNAVEGSMGIEEALEWAEEKSKEIVASYK
ncbi:MAG: ABC transporter substrate-binding protein [Spirochaetia bacterium]